MLTKRYIIISLIVYFLGLYLFFTTEFVSYQQLQGRSEKSLLEINDEQKDYLQGQGKEIFGGDEIKKQSDQRQNNNQKPVSQVVLIIIDALRYDYLQRIQFFKTTKIKYPKTTVIKKSVVGNPTMTTQRIQSMMTGSEIFTSTNILDMFLSSRIQTDNIIDQLTHHNKSVRVFGDDTWMKLFNIPQSNGFVCDSTFNIRDYDSCDELIYENLHRFIRRDKGVGNKERNDKGRIQQQGQQQSEAKQYDNLLIAHFLSIDHIGHSTSSVTSPDMQQKMHRISLYLQHLLSISASQTMFLITGDHGMREDGNHGGNSLSEIQSLFFAHYKTSNQGENFLQRMNNFQSTHVNQVDLTPTLAILLNIPNPINSIGYPILEILPYRYQKQLNKITYNILVTYQHIISHYHNTLLNDYQLEQQCNNKITSIKYSLLTHRKPTFAQFISTKQYIKTQIQQSKCLSARLAMVQPDGLSVVASLVVISVGVLLIIGGVGIDQLGYFTERLEIGQLFTNNKIVFIMLEQLGWVCSLFTIYYSWYLIRYSSTYMLILIVLFIAFIPIKYMTINKKLLGVLLLIILVQFQPPKINEYQQNYFNFNIIKNLISLFSPLSPPNQHSQSPPPIQDIKSVLHVLVIALWTIYHLKKNLRKIKKVKKSNRNKLQPPKEQHYQTHNAKSCHQVVVISILVINFIVIVMQSEINNFSINNKITTTPPIEKSNTKFLLRYIIFILLIAKLLLQHQQLSSLKMALMISFSQIFGYDNFIALLIYVQMIFLLMGLSDVHREKQKTINQSRQNSRSNRQSLNTNIRQQYSIQSSSNSLSIGTRIVVVSFISQLMWWILGNRYQYSSLDINKSYLLTDDFILPLNAFSMLLWFNGPYIITTVLTHWTLMREVQKLSIVGRGNSNNHFYSSLATHVQSNQIHSDNYNQNLEEQSPLDIPHDVTMISNEEENSVDEELKGFYISNLSKLLFVPLTGVFSSAINLYLNNMKLLFTVVYVPLMVLGTVKVIVLTILITFLILIKK